jgi:hypothetical protein
MSNHLRHRKVNARALTCRALTTLRSVSTMTNDAMKETRAALFVRERGCAMFLPMFETRTHGSEDVLDIVASPPER